MLKRNEIYKCFECGNNISINNCRESKGLTCCGKSMMFMNPLAKEGAGEKHIPIIEEIAGGILVKIGEVVHPMDENHSIKWIEVCNNQQNIKKFLKPGDQPQAEFQLDMTQDFEVRAYCDVHGLWKS
jgi:superoxide reductase